MSRFTLQSPQTKSNTATKISRNPPNAEQTLKSNWVVKHQPRIHANHISRNNALTTRGSEYQPEVTVQRSPIRSDLKFKPRSPTSLVNMQREYTSLLLKNPKYTDFLSIIRSR
jgi:hypothetical protein